MAQVRTQQFPKVPGDQGIGDKQHGGQPLPTLPETPIDDPVRMPIRPGSGRPGEGGVPQTAGAMTGVPGGGGIHDIVLSRWPQLSMILSMHNYGSLFCQNDQYFFGIKCHLVSFSVAL